MVLGWLTSGGPRARGRSRFFECGPRFIISVARISQNKTNIKKNPKRKRKKNSYILPLREKNTHLSNVLNVFPTYSWKNSGQNLSTPLRACMCSYLRPWSHDMSLIVFQVKIKKNHLRNFLHINIFECIL
jgi:hypothetical protein